MPNIESWRWTVKPDLEALVHADCADCRISFTGLRLTYADCADFFLRNLRSAMLNKERSFAANLRHLREMLESGPTRRAKFEIRILQRVSSKNQISNPK